MALPTQSYVWLKARHVIALWVERTTGLAASGATTSVIYDDQNQPRPALPYIGLVRREFPFESFDTETIVEVPTSATLTVTASAVGETVAIELFGTRYAYTLVGADTTEDARDALLALIADDLLRLVAVASGPPYAVGFQPCTATGVNIDSDLDLVDDIFNIAFAGLSIGPVSVTAIEGCTLTQTLAYRHVQSGLRRIIVRFNLYWPEREDGFDTIDEYAEALRSALLTEDSAVWLADRGVGVESQSRIAVQNAGVVSGGERQRRRFLDVIFNAPSKLYRADDGITTVEPAIVTVVELSA
jgi:hypothetical protein